MPRTRPKPPLELANLTLGFFLELAALAGFALLAALVPDGWGRFAAGALAMAVFVILWAIWAAPRSKRRLKMPALLVFKIVIFGIAAGGFVAAGQLAWAMVFAILVAVNLAVMAKFKHF